MEDGSERERGIGERECRKLGDANDRILRARERSCTRSLATTKEGKIAKCRERQESMAQKKEEERLDRRKKKRQQG